MRRRFYKSATILALVVVAYSLCFSRTDWESYGNANVSVSSFRRRFTLVFKFGGLGDSIHYPTGISARIEGRVVVLRGYKAYHRLGYLYPLFPALKGIDSSFSVDLGELSEGAYEILFENSDGSRRKVASFVVN